MCMIDDADETVDVSRHETPRARKDYRCRECGGPIVAGSMYHRFTWKDSEGWRRQVMCSACHDEDARPWLMQECGGWLIGCLREDIEEHLFEVYDRHSGNREERLRLALILQAMNRRRRAGATTINNLGGR